MYIPYEISFPCKTFPNDIFEKAALIVNIPNNRLANNVVQSSNDTQAKHQQNSNINHKLKTNSIFSLL